MQFQNWFKRPSAFLFFIFQATNSVTYWLSQNFWHFNIEMKRLYQFRFCDSKVAYTGHHLTSAMIQNQSLLFLLHGTSVRGRCKRFKDGLQKTNLICGDRGWEEVGLVLNHSFVYFVRHMLRHTIILLCEEIILTCLPQSTTFKVFQMIDCNVKCNANLIINFFYKPCDLSNMASKWYFKKRFQDYFFILKFTQNKAWETLNEEV